MFLVMWVVFEVVVDCMLIGDSVEIEEFVSYVVVDVIFRMFFLILIEYDVVSCVFYEFCVY